MYDVGDIVETHNGVGRVVFVNGGCSGTETLVSVVGFNGHNGNGFCDGKDYQGDAVPNKWWYSRHGVTVVSRDSKFNVGDEVILRRDFKVGKDYGLCILFSFMVFSGIDVVSHVADDGAVCLTLSDYIYDTNMLEKANPIEVGDIISLKRGLVVGKTYGGLTLYTHMDFKGQLPVKSITELNPGRFAYLCEVGGRSFFYPPEMIDLVNKKEAIEPAKSEPVSTIDVHDMFINGWAYVKVNNKTEFNKLMEALEARGVKWNNDELPTEYDVDVYPNYIRCSRRRLTHRSVHVDGSWKVIEFKELVLRNEI